MPASAGTGMPLRLNILYPIGFFKGSEDTYSKFLTQGDKWQIESYTAPENGKVYMNPAASAKAAAGGPKEARLTSIFRFDEIDSEGSGIRSEVQLNTDENWQLNVGFYKKVGGDEHRVLVEHGYATRNSEGLRRIPLISDMGAHFKGGKPIKVGYRVISSDYVAILEADAGRKWQLNVGGSVAGATVGGKVYDEGFGPSFDVGVGGKHDLAQGYAKFALAMKKGGAQDKIATLLLHPRLDTSKTFGLSFVTKAVLDVAKQGVREVGVTVTGAVPKMKGYDWKFNVTVKGGVISASKAITAKLPGKWTIGAGGSIADVSKLDLKDVKFGIRLTQGSTPAPL